MTFRISPLWWPVLVVASPIIVPFLLGKNRRFQENRAMVEHAKQERLSRAVPLELPELEFVELTVLAEWEKEEGFLGEPGVSYLFRTDRGSLLYDVGFGPGRKTLAHNAARLGVNLDQVDAVAISHLHLDHMGGMKASRSKQIRMPETLGSPGGKPCFLPDEAGAPGFKPELVEGPRMLAAGIATTGPLPRSLFLMGWTEEQAIVAHVRNKGLVVFTGCGHPTIELVVQMVRRLSEEPIYAVGGGLHFPVTRGRGNYGGIQVQMIVGTGMAPWRRITEDDLGRTIDAINTAGPKQVYLSAHDTCDFAIKRFKEQLTAETEVLKAGASYRF